MNLNSLLHIPKIETGLNVITGSFGTIVLSAFKDHAISVLELKKLDKQSDILVVEYNGKKTTLVLRTNDGLSCNKILRRIGVKVK